MASLYHLSNISQKQRLQLSMFQGVFTDLQNEGVMWYANPTVKDSIISYWTPSKALLRWYAGARASA